MRRFRKTSAALQVIFLFALSLLSCAGERGVRLPVVRDTGLWFYRGHPEYDFGAVEPLFVEGAHNAALLGFDVSRAAGGRVGSARLWLHRSGDQPLVVLVVSTISADWIEGGGNGTAADRQASCASYVKSDQSGRRPVRWAGLGSDVTDVIMTHGNTLLAELPVEQGKGGWQSVELPSEIAQAVINGESYGLVLMDGKGQLRHADDSFINKYFNSRDAGTYAPYLEVTIQKPPAGIPPAPVSLEVAADRSFADFAGGGVKVFISPAGEGDQRGTHYQVRYAAGPLDDSTVGQAAEAARYSIPRITAGRRDSVLLGGFPAAGAVGVAVRQVDAFGRPGLWAFAAGIASPALAEPVVAAEERPGLGGRIRVWACGIDEKVNPVNGRLLEASPALYTAPGSGDYDYMYDSHLWDAARARVSLDVPRGGTAAFQVVVSPEADSISGVSLEAGWVSPPAEAARFPVKVFKNWYLRSGRTGAWYPEVAVPLAGTFSLPDAKNAIAGQRNGSFTVEFYVPRASRAGTYRGRVIVSARGLLSRSLEVEVKVSETALPAVLSFTSEMNCYSPVGGQYGLPDTSPEYYEIEEKYYRAAHEHLSAINQLPYSQNGTIKAVGAPRLEGEGAALRVADWSDWDLRWGRYLDARAFAGTDRPVPVPVMYLPFFENWPASLLKYYRFTAHDTSYVGMVNEHTLEAPPIDKAFDPAYEEAWKNVLRQFADHFREKGWTGTEFQVYLNNKYYWKNRDPAQGFGGDGFSWWLLDEPYHWDDFKAIGFFGRLFQEAVGEDRDVNLVFRIDVSRPQLQFGLWDGLRSVSYVSSFFYEKNAYLRWRKNRFAQQYRNYGAFNGLEETNLTASAWPLMVYLGGGNGLLPWQTIASDENYERFQNTAIFYPGVRFGIEGPLVSLRLKACRKGTEDVTLLALLAEREGWSPEQAARVVAERVNLGGGAIQEFFDEAGRVNFGALAPDQLTRLRRDLLRTLDSKR